MSMLVILGIVTAAANPWEPLPGSMDSITVYSFSQSGLSDQADPQIGEVGAQLNIRTFSSWGNGLVANDYNAGHLNAARAAGVIPTSGMVPSVVFRREASSDSMYLDWVSRDALGDTVEQSSVDPGMHRGNLASPGYREHVLAIARTQIDLGTPGIFFDEVDGSYSGGAKWSYNGNEGFDDYHIGEFNQWLVNRYPLYTKADFVSAFKMAPDNALDPTLPLDPSHNFNYRTYLQAKGWARSPHAAANPLAALYGSPMGNRMQLHPTNFLDSSNTAHWREIVAATRDYARTKGHEILITSNGIEPFVDFNTFGLYSWNHDGPKGVEVDYVPVGSEGDLDARVSLLSTFQSLRARSLKESGDVPLVFFLDWPTAMINRYYGLSATRKMDYWRLYGAEAYAAGAAFAYHLRTSMPGEASALQSGILDSLRQLVGFYKHHSHLLHGLDNWAKVSSADPDLAVTAAYQSSRQRWVVQAINHRDTGTLSAGEAFVVKIKTAGAPSSISLVTPDDLLADPKPLPVDWNATDSLVTLRLSGFRTSAIAVLEMVPGTKIRQIPRSGLSRVSVQSRPGAWRLEGLEGDGVTRLRLVGGSGQTQWTRSVHNLSASLEIPSRPGIHFLEIQNLSAGSSSALALPPSLVP